MAALRRGPAAANPVVGLRNGLPAERRIARRFPAFSQDLDMILQGCAGHAGSMDTTLPKLPRAFGPFIRMRVAALVRGRRSDAVWVRPALLTLLAVTALLYLWGLGASGWANSFYSAAVQAGSSSWKAFFFGSFDSSNFITVDKPPAALWVMDISARLFGVNSWSILVPEALAGVDTVGLVVATVRRWFAAAAGLLAGAVVALTPVAALMFRFNNPDALLVLLLTAATYATVRALEDGRTRWLILAGTLVGTAFLTKMLQAFLVVPALALVFLVAAPTPVRRRLLGLLAGGVALVVSSGWWVVIVQLLPAAYRPYIGGSQDNSLINLIFGYNGFGRLTGNEAGSVGGTRTAGSMWGPTGWNRLFLADFGGQIAWLIPAALILLVAGLWITRRAPRTDRTRAAFLLWGGVLLVSGAVISFSSGIIHPYYTVALAPPVGAIVGMGVVTLWTRRDQLPWRLRASRRDGWRSAWRRGSVPGRPWRRLRGRRRCRAWRPAEQQHPRQRAGDPPVDRRGTLHMGRSHGRRELGGRLPAGDRRRSAGDRRLQRHRPHTDARPVRGGGAAAPDPLLHRRRARRRSGRGLRHIVGHHHVGGVHLHA